MTSADRLTISIFARFVGVLLWPCGAVYTLVMRCRRAMYRHGWLKSQTAGVPVICVGNLTVGGTGKTPMVAWLTQQLAAMGRRPAVLTRGYKSVAGISDEATLLTKLSSVPVIVNPDRVAGAKQAIAQGANVLVMDDGYQHLRLRRDVNIVLIDAIQPFGGGLIPGATLPAGRMREGLSALADADVIVFTRTDRAPAERVADLWSRIAEIAPDAQLATAVHRPTVVIDEAGNEQPAETLAGRKVFLFCGLGNPEAFRQTAAALKANIVGTRWFSDHANYTPADVQTLLAEAKGCGAEMLLTTQKDGVKLPTAPTVPPIRQLAVEMDITDGYPELLDLLDAVMKKAAT